MKFWGRPVGCLDALVERALARHPHRLALRSAGRDVRCDELRRRLLGLASRLRALGVATGDRVGLHVTHGDGLVVGMLGILAAGAVCVPIDVDAPDARVTELLTSVEARAAVSARADLSIPVVRLEGHESDAAPRREHDIDDPAFIFFTSGSTGQPKGVLQTHRQVCLGQLGPLAHFALLPGDRVLLRAPIATSGIACEILWPLLSGAAMVAAGATERSDPRALVRLVRDERVSLLIAVPSLLRSLLLEPDLTHCSSLHHVVTAGEAMGADLAAGLEALSPAVLSVIYGTTEAPSTTIRTVRSGDDARNVGRPLWCKRVYIMDEAGQPATAGTVGEIYVGGGIAEGYWKLPAETARRFTGRQDERLYRTGDMGRLLADGSLELWGRADDQIKIGGLRIEPAEIEAALRQFPAVREAVVRKDAAGRLLAWLTGTTVATAELRKYVQERLPPHMRPAGYVWLDVMPRTPAGKIDRAALPEAQAASVGPAASLQAVLTRRWSEAFGTTVGPDDDFVALGGNSSMAIELVAAIERDTGTRLPLQVLMQGATIERVAGMLHGQVEVPHGSLLVPLQPQGDRPPFFMVHALMGGPSVFAATAQLLTSWPVYALQAEAHAGGALEHRPLLEMASEYVQAIRSVQPHGPYRLGGYSLGGVIALEMARLLRAGGEAVPLLVMFDTLAPGFQKFSYGAMLSQLGDLPFCEWPHFVRSRVRGWRHRVRSRVGRRDDARPGSVTEALATALRGYRWSPYEGDVTLLCSSNRHTAPAWQVDPLLGWRRWVRGELEVRAVPGSHNEFFAAANVPHVARELSQLLQRADAAVSSASCP
jgi:amino acid adenylation domain-containing protein